MWHNWRFAESSAARVIQSRQSQSIQCFFCSSSSLGWQHQERLLCLFHPTVCGQFFNCSSAHNANGGGNDKAVLIEIRSCKRLVPIKFDPLRIGGGEKTRIGIHENGTLCCFAQLHTQRVTQQPRHLGWKDCLSLLVLSCSYFFFIKEGLDLKHSLSSSFSCMCCCVTTSQ